MSSDDDDEHESANVRALLKIVRDPSKTAYDLLPNGETLGSFANRHAVENYIHKNNVKRQNAKEFRKRKRITKFLQKKPVTKKA